MPESAIHPANLSAALSFSRFETVDWVLFIFSMLVYAFVLLTLLHCLLNKVRYKVLILLVIPLVAVFNLAGMASSWGVTFTAWLSYYALSLREVSGMETDVLQMVLPLGAAAYWISLQWLRKVPGEVKTPAAHPNPASLPLYTYLPRGAAPAPAFNPGHSPYMAPGYPACAPYAPAAQPKPNAPAAAPFSYAPAPTGAPSVPAYTPGYPVAGPSVPPIYPGASVAAQPPVHPFPQQGTPNALPFYGAPTNYPPGSSSIAADPPPVYAAPMPPAVSQYAPAPPETLRSLRRLRGLAEPPAETDQPPRHLRGLPGVGAPAPNDGAPLPDGSPAPCGCAECAAPLSAGDPREPAASSDVAPPSEKP